LAIDRNRVVAEAQKHIQKGAFKRAIAEYERIMREQPDDVRILMKIGDLQVRDGQTREAIRTYTEVADYYVANGFFLKAVAVYKQVIQLAPQSIDSRVRLAELYYQLGLVSDAVVQFQSVAAAYQQNGHGAAYVKTLERMAEVDPGNVGNRIKLAETLAKAGSAMSAAIHFAAAADMLQEAGRFEEYVKVVERYLHLLPDDVEMVRALARTYVSMQKPIPAIQRLQPRLKKGSYERDDVLIVVDAVEQLGEHDRAAEILREAAEEFEAAGRSADREVVLERLLELDPHDAGALAALGRHGGEVQELDTGAFEVLDEDDASSDETAAKVAEMLAESEIFAKYGLWDRMIDHLAQVFALDPENLEAMAKRAEAMKAAGRLVEAAQELVRMGRILAPRDRAAATDRVNDALALAPGLPEAVQLRGTLREGFAVITLHPTPSEDVQSALRAARAQRDAEAAGASAPPAPTPTPAPAPTPDRPAFDELDSLFAAFDGPADAGDASLDMDSSFMEHIAEVDSAHAEASGNLHVPRPPEVYEPPPAFEAQLDRVDALVDAGRITDAHALLLNLVGEFPEFAERLMARMDMLPTVSSVDIGAFGDTVPGVRPVVEPSNVHRLFVPAPPAEVPDGDDGLFLAEDGDLTVPPGTRPPPVVDGPSDFARDEVPPTGPSLRSPAAMTPPPPPPLFLPAEEVAVLADFDEPSALITVPPPGALAAPDPSVDAPFGRSSSAARQAFGPTTRALAAEPDGDFAQGVAFRRDGNTLMAVELLQHEQFGDFPVASQFELAVANIELGLYFEAVATLEALFNAAGLDEADRRMLSYHLGVAYEALAQTEQARPLFARLAAEAPDDFPDAAVRLARI
jgi:tetratricopeptide (TPR) repeat protein